jgi:hypothetical protein
MAEQDVSLELYYDAAWHDVVSTNDVLADTPVTIVRGQGEEGAAFRPAQITARLKNDDDAYRTTNPTSALYGKAGRNTPLRAGVAGSVRGQVQASSWKTGQTQDFRAAPLRGSAWVDLQGAGLLQQVNQWSKPIQSAMSRWADRRTDLVDYWPGYDSGQATSIASVTGGTEARAETGFKLDTTFDQKDAPYGSEAAFQIGTESALVAPFQSSAVPAGNWTMLTAFKLTKPVPDASPGQPLYLIEMPNLWSATVYIYDDSYELEVLSANEATTYDELQTYSAADSPSQWILMSVSMTRSGTTNSMRWSWYPQGGAVRTFTGSVTSAAPIPPLDWRINANTNIIGAQYGEIMMLSTSSLFTIDSDLQQAFDGYNGERSSYRFARLCTEEDIGYFVSTGFAVSSPMGPQRPDTLANLITEIVTTEDALLFDYISDNRLYFVSRFDRYNQTSALDLATIDLPALPDEVTDDLDVHNIVTASQRDGGSAIARDDAGPLGTATPPTGVGEYRQTVDVNVTSEFVLPQVANWWLRRGTVDLPRYPQVTIDLAAKPSLVARVEAVDVGSVITITGYREDVIRLQVIGIREVIGTHTRLVTFTCVPDRQFQVAVYVATGATVTSSMRRYDSRTSTTNATLTTTATTIVVTFTDSRDAWSTVNVPYDWVIAGERITVTAMGAVTGAGPYTQSATVTRSVNGVVKTHAAGESIHMHPDQQARYAL